MMTQRRHPDLLSAEDAPQPVYRLDTMTQDDVPEVSRVERRCFPNPWPASAYRRELQNPAQNHYVVLREIRAASPAATITASANDAPEDAPVPFRPLPRRSLLPLSLGRRPDANGSPESRIVGFAGMWLAFDEAHVTTIGVDPDHRGFGLGELLFLCMIDAAFAKRANWLTLEVRVSNTAAQTLYQKYQFTVHGTRKRYYSDNNEDALIMWSPALHDDAFRAAVDRRRGALAHRLAGMLGESAASPFLMRAGRTGTS